MNKLLILLSLCLAGCIAGTDSPEPLDEPTPDNSINMPYNNDPGPQGCSQHTMLHVSVDGSDFWVLMPTLCDHRPYIFKGDPGPDFGDPWDEEVGVSQESILQEMTLKAEHLNLQNGSFGLPE